jgi:myo-inositol catabolism protein IolS
MQYRPLGKTGLHVSTISLGTWAMGGDRWGPIDDAESLAALDQARNLGVNFFDTADSYGRGHSEEVLGKWLKTVERDRVYIATKVGLLFDHYTPYRRLRRKITRAATKIGLPVRLNAPHRYLRPAQIIAACEGSLQRLGTDYIDVYQDHLWWDEHVEVFAEAFHRLREAGKIRFFGVSADDVQYIRRFNAVVGGMDTLQIDYSILNREPEREALPFCQEHQIGVIVRGPLAMGKLTGKFTPVTTFPDGDQRKAWLTDANHQVFLNDLERVRQLASLATGRTMTQLALAYVLHHPVVSTAIPGAKNPRQVTENVAAAEQTLTCAELTLIDRIVPCSSRNPVFRCPSNSRHAGS